MNVQSAVFDLLIEKFDCDYKCAIRRDGELGLYRYAALAYMIRLKGDIVRVSNRNGQPTGEFPISDPAFPDNVVLYSRAME